MDVDSVWEYNAPQFVDFCRPIHDDPEVDDYVDIDHEGENILKDEGMLELVSSEEIAASKPEGKSPESSEEAQNNPDVEMSTYEDAVTSPLDNCGVRPATSDEDGAKRQLESSKKRTKQAHNSDAGDQCVELESCVPTTNAAVGATVEKTSSSIIPSNICSSVEQWRSKTAKKTSANKVCDSEPSMAPSQESARLRPRRPNVERKTEEEEEGPTTSAALETEKKQHIRPRTRSLDRGKPTPPPGQNVSSQPSAAGEIKAAPVLKRRSQSQERIGRQASPSVHNKKANVGKLTMPCTPSFMKNKFKAQPLNQKIFGHPIMGIRKVNPKECTVTESFDLEIEKRLQHRKRHHSESTDEPHLEFHAQPLPKKILLGPVVIKIDAEPLPERKPSSDLAGINIEPSDADEADGEKSDRGTGPDIPQNVIPQITGARNKSGDTPNDEGSRDDDPKDDPKKVTDGSIFTHESLVEQLESVCHTLAWLEDRPPIGKRMNIAPEIGILFHGNDSVTTFTEAFLKQKFLNQNQDIFFSLDAGKEEWDEQQFLFDEAINRSPAVILLKNLERANAVVAEELTTNIERIYREKQLILVVATTANEVWVERGLRLKFKAVFALPPDEDDDDDEDNSGGQ